MELAATGRRWAVASPHTAATQAGAEAFEAGGNALDAALATAITLAVVYPQACGVGGDLFALIERAENHSLRRGQLQRRRPRRYRPRGRPRRARRDARARPAHDHGARRGGGLESDLRPGREVRLAPALRHRDRLRARRDAPCPARSPRRCASTTALVGADPGIAGVFYPDGKPLAEGDLLRQPALAATMEALAAQGPEALYGGELGRTYAHGLRAAGSPLTLEDLAAHQAQLVPPLAGRYRDLDVRVVPPNSQGFVLLEILAAIERMGIDPDPLGPDAGDDGADRARGPRRPRPAPGGPRGDAGPRGARSSTTGHIAALTDAGPRAHRGSDRRCTGPRTPGDTIGLVTADAEGNAVA